MSETQVRSLGQEDSLEHGMATHSSILAWRIPWTAEPGGLQPIGSQRVRNDWSDLAHTHSMSSIKWKVERVFLHRILNSIRTELRCFEYFKPLNKLYASLTQSHRLMQMPLLCICLYWYEPSLFRSFDWLLNVFHK